MTEQHEPGPIYDWPNQRDVHEKAMKIISEEAHDSLGLEWQTTDVPELDQAVSPAHAPGLGDALRETAETYYPSDLLANLLDQEMRDLAHNVLEDLPEGQREALVRAAVDRIREHREDGPEPAAGNPATENPETQPVL